jgi:CheY-like chemotaxis protein
MKNCSDTRILLVEDSAIIAYDLTISLESAGFPVIGPAGNLEEATRYSLSPGFDFAILDIHLGAQTVFPAAEILRQRGIPFLFLTAYDRQIIPVQFAEYTCLEKPAIFSDLISAIEQATSYSPAAHILDLAQSRLTLTA